MGAATNAQLSLSQEKTEMKTQKNAVVAAAIVTGLTAFSAVQAAPVVYGKANISVQSTDNGTDDAILVNSNASRLGIKGKVKLPEGGTAIYQAEYEIDVDAGDDVFKQRSIYAGLKGSAGTVKVGHFDTIIKKAQGKVDLFNDLKVGDIKSVIDGENRGSNTVQFESNKFADGAVQIKAALFQGEQAGVSGQDGIADGIALGVDYSAGPLTAALAYSDNTVKNATITLDSSIIRASAQFKLENGIKLGALVQQQDLGATDGMGYVVSASMPFGEGYAFKVQFAAADDDIALGNVESQLNVGIDHKISKKIKTFAYYGSQEKNDNTDGSSTVGAGMEIKF
jgi:predicted porin